MSRIYSLSSLVLYFSIKFTASASNSRVLSSNLTDIELLFNIFKNPRHVKAAFGYFSFADFASCHPHIASQRHWLQHRSPMKIIFHELQRDRVQIISTTFDGADVGISNIDWDAVERLDRLTHLVIAKSRISGVVPFDKLPRHLISLFLTDNYLTGIVNPEQCPSTLRYLDLSGRYLDLSGSPLA